MRKKLLCMTLFAAIAIMYLMGCEKAPDTASDQEILRAQNEKEENEKNVVANIVNKNLSEDDSDRESRHVKCELGSEDNVMKVDAELPAAPMTAATLKMTSDSQLDEVKIKSLFEEGDADVRDVTDEKLKQLEEEQNSIPLEDRVVEEQAHLGEDDYLVLETEKEKVSCWSHSLIGYTNYARVEKTRKIIANNEGEKLLGTDISPDQADNLTLSGFSFADARKLLLDKLKRAGVEDIYIYDITGYECQGEAYYEVFFVPAFEGIPIMYDFRSRSIGEICTEGKADICQEGVATMSFVCMEEISREEGKCLSWNQTSEILTTYLENKTLQCSEKKILNHVMLAYLPVTEGNTLKLIPIWWIYVPYWELFENEEAMNADGLEEVAIHAVTGEIERVEK